MYCVQPNSLRQKPVSTRFYFKGLASNKSPCKGCFIIDNLRIDWLSPRTDRDTVNNKYSSSVINNKCQKPDKSDIKLVSTSFAMNSKQTTDQHTYWNFWHCSKSDLGWFQTIKHQRRKLTGWLYSSDSSICP